MAVCENGHLTTMYVPKSNISLICYLVLSRSGFRTYLRLRRLNKVETIVAYL